MQSIGTYVLYVKNEKKKINVDQLKMATSIYRPYCLNFKKNDGLPFCLDKLKGNYDILENALIKREAKYHKCYNDYSEEKLKRAKERQNKSNVVSDTTEQLRGLSQSTRSRDTSANSFIIFVPKQTQKTILEQHVHFMQQKIKLI